MTAHTLFVCNGGSVIFILPIERSEIAVLDRLSCDVFQSISRPGKVKTLSALDMAHERASEWFTDPRISLRSGYTRPGRCRALEAQSVERKLSAIFAADVEGYSRLMGQDEVGTLRTLTAYRVIIDRLIASHRGRIFNTAGDSLVADFASAVDAVQCAVEIQRAIGKENADRPAGEQMGLRIGIRVGDIIFQGNNLFGDAVNIAARLEALAEPGGICVPGTVQDQGGLPVKFWQIDYSPPIGSLTHSFTWRCGARTNYSGH
jgi:class 3 adenylate cyclase